MSISELVAEGVEYVSENPLKVALSMSFMAFTIMAKLWEWASWAFTKIGEWLTVILGFTVSRQVAGETVQHWLNLANYFFPLDIVLAQGLALGVLWTVCWAYRAVKSWIPTVA